MKSAVWLCLVVMLVTQMAFGQGLSVDEQHTSVKFQIKNFGLEVEGSLSNIRGSVVFDRNNLTASSFHLSADASTIDTGIALRNKHLQKPEYLDARNHPTLEFTSTGIVQTKNMDEVLVTGNMTIKNTTKQIQVLVKLIPSEKTVNFEGSFMINRLDYKVGSSSVTLSDEVVVSFRLALMFTP